MTRTLCERALIRMRSTSGTPKSKVASYRGIRTLTGVSRRAKASPTRRMAPSATAPPSYGRATMASTARHPLTAMTGVCAGSSKTAINAGGAGGASMLKSAPAQMSAFTRVGDLRATMALMWLATTRTRPDDTPAQACASMLAVLALTRSRRTVAVVPRRALPADARIPRRRVSVTVAPCSASARTARIPTVRMVESGTAGTQRDASSTLRSALHASASHPCSPCSLWLRRRGAAVRMVESWYDSGKRLDGSTAAAARRRPAAR